jgi:hypothetical protein
VWLFEFFVLNTNANGKNNISVYGKSLSAPDRAERRRIEPFILKK